MKDKVVNKFVYTWFCISWISIILLHLFGGEISYHTKGLIPLIKSLF